MWIGFFQRCSFLLSSYRNLWFRAFYLILQMLFLSFCNFNMANYVPDSSVNFNHIESISTLFKTVSYTHLTLPTTPYV